MMKSWHLLIQKIEIWRQQNQLSSSLLWRKKNTRDNKPINFQSPRRLRKQQHKKRKNRFRQFTVMLAAAIIALTSVVGYRFYNQPQLTVGKISPVTIRAPYAGRFEDTKTTLEKRKEVQTGIVPILKQNKVLTEDIKSQLSKYLEQIDRLRKLTSPFPFFDTKILSLSSQKYIRACSDSEFKVILAAVDYRFSRTKSKAELPVTLDNQSDFNIRLQKVVSELKTYRQKASQSEFDTLVAQISLTRYRYAQGWKKLEQQPMTSLNQEEITTLLDLTEPDWIATKKNIGLATERILTQGIPLGMPSDLLEQAVTVQLNSELNSNLPPSVSHIASNMLLNILQPNLEEDKDATRNIAEKAARAIEPVIVEIGQGEVIVEQGARITQANFVLLDGFRLSRRSINWHGLQIAGAFVASIVLLFLLIQKRVYTSVRRRDYLLLCLLGISAPLLSVMNVPYTNLPAIGLLVSSFYAPSLAICMVSLLTILVTFSNNAISWQYLLAGSAGGLLAAALAGRLRSREAMAKLGVMVGLTQGGVYFVSNLILSSSATTIWSAILPDAINYGLSGVAWSIVAIGISPYLERFFDLVTPIRLAELSNPNLPLLKRLATEAPGTFQHTMFVASLAEAAARELNCNVELVRAGTLYHDVGKMHDPLGFIENQMGGTNKHDKIDDPWKSAAIIKKHVTEGLVMARKYGLPKAIRDFIPEHQGTLLITYFYYQAKQKAEAEGTIVLESDFRYAGPIPQSREAGIMMLADGCEAALRSLKDATPKQALATIQKIFKARWQDGQLVDSGLNYEELPVIAEVFVRVWQQFNHKRIAYPKGALESNSSD
ncbi:MAG: HDIG domain-containing protein [Pleurocapsa sp.]